MIVLDSSVLSHVFRRTKNEEPHAVVDVFRRLVDSDTELLIPGIVYQELLSGVRTSKAAKELERALEGFPVVLATRGTHRLAADVSNECRAKGVTIASFDALVGAHTIERDAALLTLDGDFRHMARASTRLRLHPASA